MGPFGDKKWGISPIRPALADDCKLYLSGVYCQVIMPFYLSRPSNLAWPDIYNGTVYRRSAVRKVGIALQNTTMIIERPVFDRSVGQRVPF